MEKIYIITFNTLQNLNQLIGFTDNEKSAKQIKEYIDNALMREKLHKTNYDPDNLYTSRFVYEGKSYHVNYRGAWSEYFELNKLESEWLEKNI